MVDYKYHCLQPVPAKLLGRERCYLSSVVQETNIIVLVDNRSSLLISKFINYS